MSSAIAIGTLEATVISVEEELAQTELEVAATAGATVLEVVDLDALDYDGGTLQIGAEVISYLIDEDSDELELSSPLGSSYPIEEPVSVYPPSIARIAYVRAGDDDEELEARVPHALFDRLDLGTRDETDESAELVLLALEDEEWVITDLLYQEPVIDGAFIDPETLPAPPPAEITDGLAPSSSPTPTVSGGPGYLFAEWAAIVNPDFLTYEVHVSASSGFAPSGATAVASTPGLSSVIVTLGDGTPLEPGTTYYVKLIALDADGAAAASAQGSGSPTAIEIAHIEPIDFTDITGQATNAQIVGLAASKVTGQMTNAQIADLAAAKVTGQMVEAQIADNAVTAAKVAANAITTSELADDAVTAAELAANAVDASAIASGAVTAGKIGPDAVGPTELAALAVTSAKLAANAVTVGKIAADAVDAGAIATGAVGSLELADGAVGMAEFASGIRPPRVVTSLPTTPFTGWAEGDTAYLTTDDKLYRFTGSGFTAAVPAADLSGTINTTQIADDAINAAKIAADAVTASEIATGAVGSGEIAAGAVIAGKITAGTIVAADIASGTITAGQIAGDTITAGQIAASAITATELAANSVIAGKILAGTIVAADIAANVITAGQIATGAIAADEIAAGAVVAGKIATDAITANEIQANAITASELAANSITAADMLANTVTASQIAANTLTAAEINAGAITSSELAAGAVIAGKILAGSIVATDLAANTITANEIAADAITTSELAAGAVTAGNILAGSIVAGDLAANTLTAGQIATGAIASDEIAANTIVAGDIAADTITAAEIAANAITATELNAGAVIAGKIAAGTIVAGDIAANVITAGQIAAGAIEAAEIAAGAVVAGKIATGSIVAGDIAANTLTADRIATNAITSDELAANAVIAGKILAGSIVATDIAANTITAAQIATAAIEANEIAAGAITATKIAADAIDAMTITGGLIRTSASGDRMEMGVSPVDGFKGIRALTTIAGVATYPIWLDAITGDARFRGVMDFGSSRLSADNVVELDQQATGYMTPAVAQSIGASGSSGSTGLILLPAATQTGSVLLVALEWENASATPPTAPFGWTHLVTTTQSDRRLSVYYRPAGVAEYWVPSFTFPSTSPYMIQFFELSGVASIGTATSGSGGSPSANLSFAATPANDSVLSLIYYFTSPGATIGTPTGYTSIRDDTDATNYRDMKASIKAGATTTANSTLTGAGSWIAQAVRLVAKLGVPAAPASGKLRLYTKQVKVEGVNKPHLFSMDSAGLQRAIGTPQFDIVNLAADYTLTATMGAGVPGLSKALDNDGTYEVTVHAHLNFTSGTPGQTEVGLTFNGAPQTGRATTVHTVGRTTISRTWKVSGLAGYVCQITAGRTSAGGVDIKATDSVLVIKQIA